jgi:hypothetical protein
MSKKIYKYTYNKNCEYCGKPFVTERSATKICSQECVSANNSNKKKGVIRVDKDKEASFVELAQTDASMHKIRRELGLGYGAAKTLAEKYNFTHLIRTQEEGSEGRRLTLEEAQLKVKDGKVISFNDENKKYKIECNDGSFYEKDTAHLSQGKPSRKSPTYKDKNLKSEEAPSIGPKVILRTIVAEFEAIYMLGGKQIPLKIGESYTWQELEKE